LTDCGEVRNRAEECNDKSARRDPWPHAIAIQQDGRKRDSVCRPHRPEITAPNVGSCLAKLTCNQIREKHEQYLYIIILEYF
jgi:hypothetical protein